MAIDVNSLLGNTIGCVLVFNDAQVSGPLYTTEYIDRLEESAASGEPGRKEATAHSQGIYENSKEMRKKVERIIMENVTKIGGVYDFNGKKLYLNQTLGRDQALDFITAGNLNGLLTHPDTEVWDNTTDTSNLIDALIGGS